MALESEGQGKLESLGFEVLYCGIGKVNATYHLTKRLAKNPDSITQVINLGSAGSHTFPTGKLVAADRFVQRDMDLTGLSFEHGTTPFEDIPPMLQFSRSFDHLEHGICGTGDSFLQGTPPFLVTSLIWRLMHSPKCALWQRYSLCVQNTLPMEQMQAHLMIGKKIQFLPQIHSLSY